ncbi:MAG: putative HAD-hydrolase [Methanoregula sp. PtaU1.Bin051]|nr:MAG: putative HAD-hydrolase [Methanoregula sp. PtaU1.Bin051]
MATPDPVRRPVSAVLFDMDNTLFDFVEAQLFACRAILGHTGISDRDEDLFSYFRRTVHGFEHHANIRDFLSDNGAFTVRLFAECCAVYEAAKVAAIRPYPGIMHLLESLHKNGIPLAIVTDAPAVNATRRMERAGLSGYFTALVSPDQSGAAKPDPASFLLALECLGTGAEETALVGDNIRRDIAPAQRLGMVTLYAKYGDRYRSGQDASCVPDYTAENVAEAGELLYRLTGCSG